MKLFKKAILILIPVFFVVSHTHAQNDNWDIRVLRNIEEHRTDSKTSFYKTISATTIPFSLAAPAAYLVTGMIRHDNDLKKTALYLTESMAITQFITFSTKAIVNRPRPYEYDSTLKPVVKANNASFPSGHTSAAFNLATSLTIINPKWYVVVPAFTWASLVGYSRLYLGVHYPSDVIVGAIIGSGSAWLSYKLNKWMKGKKKKDHPPVAFN